MKLFWQLFEKARLRRALAALGDWEPPADPFIPVREPKRRAPGDRGAAVAVAEPNPPVFVSAVAHPVRDRD
jgi:hypothetical protein